jgi:hypothetical protein
MTLPIRCNVIPIFGSRLLIARRGWTALGPGRLLLIPRRGGLGPDRYPRGTASGDVSSANLGASAAAWPSGAPSVLRRSSDANQK